MIRIAIVLSALVLAVPQEPPSPTAPVRGSRAGFGGQDVEAKKKRLAEVMKDVFALQKKAERTADDVKRLRELQTEGDALLKELTGGVREKETDVILDAVSKYAPELKPEIEAALIAARETSAMALLKTLASAEELWRMETGKYWLADVSGLHRGVLGGRAAEYVDARVARADAKPCVALDKEGEADGVKLVAVKGKGEPVAGYWVVVVPKYQDDKGEWVAHDPAGGRWAVCAYPAEHGKTGKRTFLVTQDARIRRKDTGGKPVEGVPADPKKEGWE